MALMPVADALAAILAGAEPLPEEMVALDAAYHRVLARDSPRGAPSRRRRCRRWTAMRCARPTPPISRARLKVIGEVAAGRPFERKVGARRSGADFHRRRDSRRRRRRHHPGRHRRRRRPHHHHRSRRDRDGISAPPASISARATCCSTRGRRLTDRDLSLAAGMNYPELAGAPPPEGRGARAPATNW